MSEAKVLVIGDGQVERKSLWGSARAIVTDFMARETIDLFYDGTIVVDATEGTESESLFVKLVAYYLSSMPNATVVLKEGFPAAWDEFESIYVPNKAQHKETKLTKEKLIEYIKDYPDDAEVVLPMTFEPENYFNYYWHDERSVRVVHISGDPDRIILEL